MRLDSLRPKEKDHLPGPHFFYLCAVKSTVIRRLFIAPKIPLQIAFDVKSGSYAGFSGSRNYYKELFNSLCVKPLSDFLKTLLLEKEQYKMQKKVAEKARKCKDTNERDL